MVPALSDTVVIFDGLGGVLGLFVLDVGHSGGTSHFVPDDAAAAEGSDGAEQGLEVVDFEGYLEVSVREILLQIGDSQSAPWCGRSGSERPGLCGCEILRLR